jgi:hypothetical protein
MSKSASNSASTSISTSASTSVSTSASTSPSTFASSPYYGECENFAVCTACLDSQVNMFKITLEFYSSQ